MTRYRFEKGDNVKSLRTFLPYVRKGDKGIVMESYSHAPFVKWNHEAIPQRCGQSILGEPGEYMFPIYEDCLCLTPD